MQLRISEVKQIGIFIKHFLILFFQHGRECENHRKTEVFVETDVLALALKPAPVAACGGSCAAALKR